MRGWVYVITTKSMPHLVKVGFSTKDPAIRARELANTGTPHPYVVVYDALVHGPRGAERQIHAKLSHVREGKEWFKCSVAEAVSAIKETLREGVLLEQVNLTTQIEENSDARNNRGSARQIPQAQSGAAPTYRAIATYAGSCTYCGEHFSATLTRYDTIAKCPNCLRASDVSGFIKSELLL